MAFETIDVYLWQKQIFNYHIAKGYLTFNQLANLISLAMSIKET